MTSTLQSLNRSLQKSLHKNIVLNSVTDMKVNADTLLNTCFHLSHLQAWMQLYRLGFLPFLIQAIVCQG